MTRLAIAAALVLCASTAHADEAADRARAARLLDRGAKLVRASDPACLEPLGVAAGLDASAPVLGELALCEEVAGRRAAAYEHVGRALDKMPAGAATREPWRRFVEAQRRLERRVARAVLSVSPQEAEVFVDGRPLGARASGRIVALDPGEHTWTARAAGFVDAKVVHTVAAGDLPPVRIELLALPPKPPPAAGPIALVAPVAPPPKPSPWFVPSASPRGALLGLTYTSAVVGLVAGAVAVGLELDLQAKRGELLQAGFGATTCASSSRPVACGTVHDKLDARNAARGVAIGGAGATVVFGALALIVGATPIVGKESAGVFVWSRW